MNDVSQTELLKENERLKAQLTEANDTLDAIRTGQIDALVVNNPHDGPSLYTLRSADRAYRFFIEQMTEGAVTLNNDGLIIYSNSQFAKLVHRRLEHVIGVYFSDLVCREDLTLFHAMFAQTWGCNVKSELRLSNGETHVPVQLSLNCLKMDDHTTLSMIVTDLTRRKEIERQLTASNQELLKLNDALISSNHDLQQFASIASHDLQEPLRKIQVYSKFLIDRGCPELSQPFRNYIQKIFASSQRMKTLIVDILTYSKLSAADAHCDAVNLNLIVNEILEDFDLRISEKNAHVKVSDLCTVEGNQGQLRQVFHNLISNALKFTSPDRQPFIRIERKAIDATEIGVTLENPDQYCRVAVSDNGIGFEESYASVIFSLFEKLNSKNTYEGSGIGLAIAKKVIEKHHGLIIARSKVGAGSEFSAILPFKQPVAD